MKKLNSKNNNVNPNELRRKIIMIAKELFMNPTEDGVASKSKAPSKKQIISKLTQEEIQFINENPDIVFPKNMPERLIWDSYSGRNMEKRKEVLLRVVAEDNALIAEKNFISSQNSEEEHYPTRQEVLNVLPQDEREVILRHKSSILSTTKSLGQLNKKDRIYYFKNGSLPTQKAVDTKLQELYIKYIEEQEDFFVLYMNFVNDLMFELKKYRQVHDSTKISDRIKSSDSALKNDPKKALDDVFGMEIAFSNDDEKNEIEQVISSTIDISKEKRHNKSNGYIAYHIFGTPTDINKDFKESKLYSKLNELYNGTIYYNNLMYNTNRIWNVYKQQMIEKLRKHNGEYNINNEDINELLNNLMVGVEIQLKTIEKEEHGINGPSAHYKYEATNKGANKLTPEEEKKAIEDYKKAIQEKYTSIIKLFGTIPLSHVAKMWESRIDGKKPRQLSSMEVIKHIYPFFIDPKDLEEPTRENGEIVF